MADAFIPHEVFERLADSSRATIAGCELVISPAQERFRCEEAIRVLREVASGNDPLGLCGTVRTRAAIDALGGEILGDSLLLDDSAYEVVCGLLCKASELPAPPGTAETALASLAS
ncbi:MAG: hypothetical protein EXR75_02990 [Myxococcales bacterium]|nr:hypothetical protein [Myxococcales bacterium]